MTFFFLKRHVWNPRLLVTVPSRRLWLFSRHYHLTFLGFIGRGCTRTVSCCLPLDAAVARDAVVSYELRHPKSLVPITRILMRDPDGSQMQLNVLSGTLSGHTLPIKHFWRETRQLPIGSYNAGRQKLNYDKGGFGQVVLLSFWILFPCICEAGMYYDFCLSPV